MANKIKKQTFFNRIRAAIRALRGKPRDSITLGVEVKECRKCERGDCDTCVYKSKFEHWMSMPNCNDCSSSASGYCGVCPLPGDDVRINCPLWEPKGKRK